MKKITWIYRVYFFHLHSSAQCALAFVSFSPLKWLWSRSARASLHLRSSGAFQSLPSWTVFYTIGHPTGTEAVHPLVLWLCSLIASPCSTAASLPLRDACSLWTPPSLVLSPQENLSFFFCVFSMANHEQYFIFIGYSWLIMYLINIYIINKFIA